MKKIFILILVFLILPGTGNSQPLNTEGHCEPGKCPRNTTSSLSYYYGVKPMKNATLEYCCTSQSAEEKLASQLSESLSSVDATEVLPTGCYMTKCEGFPNGKDGYKTSTITITDYFSIDVCCKTDQELQATTSAAKQFYPQMMSDLFSYKSWMDGVMTTIDPTKRNNNSKNNYNTDQSNSNLKQIPDTVPTVSDTNDVTDINGCGSTKIFSDLINKGVEIFEGLREIIYVVAGFGILAVAIGGFFGNLNWKWLGVIVIGLMVIASTGEILKLITGCENIINIADTLK